MSSPFDELQHIGQVLVALAVPILPDGSARGNGQQPGAAPLTPCCDARHPDIATAIWTF